MSGRIINAFFLGFQCSEACGGGVKERKVVCQPFDGTREALDEEMCAELKPRSSIPCNQQSCKRQTTVWNSGEWSKVNPKRHLNAPRELSYTIISL